MHKCILPNKSNHFELAQSMHLFNAIYISQYNVNSALLFPIIDYVHTGVLKIRCFWVKIYLAEQNWYNTDFHLSWMSQNISELFVVKREQRHSVIFLPRWASPRWICWARCTAMWTTWTCSWEASWRSPCQGLCSARPSPALWLTRCSGPWWGTGSSTL